MVVTVGSGGRKCHRAEVHRGPSPHYLKLQPSQHALPYRPFPAFFFCTAQHPPIPVCHCFSSSQANDGGGGESRTDSPPGNCTVRSPRNEPCGSRESSGGAAVRNRDRQLQDTGKLQPATCLCPCKQTTVFTDEHLQSI